MTTPAPLKRTPFYDFHQKHHARMVDFAGWEMPLLYPASGIIAEHNHTRSAASIFDVSHMGRLKFSGKDATAFLNRVLTRNLSAAVPGQSLYSHVCNESGGILDDVIAARHESHWLVVCNASNREKLLAWFRAQLQAHPLQVKIQDETFETAMVALQGPKVIPMLNDLLPDPVDHLKRYHFMVQRYMMIVQFTVSRSGYTGEDGVEITISNSTASMAMKFLLSDDAPTAILKPAGLGARDLLRLEAGMPLYGHELGEDTDPLSAGLGWAVDLTKDFIGADALRKIQQAGPTKKLVGLLLDGPRTARPGMTVKHSGKPVGTITSAAQSPTLSRPIAMAYVTPESSAPGTPLTIDLTHSETPATVTPLPFYKRPK